MPILLSNKEIKTLIDVTEVIDAVENGFKQFNSGQCLVPLRMEMKMKSVDGLFLFMPAFKENEAAFGTKIVSVFPNNRMCGLSTIQGVYLLNNPETGELQAIMDGTFLTAIRTGAASAVATKYLAKENSQILGLIGAGDQMFFQAQAISHVRSIKKIFVYDKNLKLAEKFSQTTSQALNIPIEVSLTPHDVVVNSDILTTATTSFSPVFDGQDLKPGTHINAVGNHSPLGRELDDVTVKSAKIILDTYDGCLSECGDLLIPLREQVISKDDLYADIGEIVTGKKPGRTNSEEITLFESVGFALEDLVTASIAYKKAREKNIGLKFNLS